MTSNHFSNGKSEDHFSERKSDYIRFLCHDCHKKLSHDDVAGTDIPAGSEMEEGCVRCVIPETQIEFDLLPNPLYKCGCGRILFAMIPELFDCEECQYNYYNMITIVDDVLMMNGIEVVPRELDRVVDLAKASTPLVVVKRVKRPAVPSLFGLKEDNA